MTKNRKTFLKLQMTADKAALEREMNALRTDNDRLRVNTETMVAEKWELSAANAGSFGLNFRTCNNFSNLFCISFEHPSLF